MRDAGATPEPAADAYDALLRAHGPLDLVHLGLGPDGHTASLFPGSPSLDVRDRLVVTTGDDLHPHPRVTVTYPALAQRAADRVHRRRIRQARRLRRGPAGADVPAARVRGNRVIWLVDRAAAGANSLR